VVERTVSIGGNSEDIIKTLREMLRDAEAGVDPEVLVMPNASTQPPLRLRFTREDGEWQPGDPLLVDYE
jgi:hypothetical protein